MRRETKLKFKKTTALLLAFIFIISIFPGTKAEAAGERWISSADGWHYLEGTNIKVQIANDIIRVCGSGAIPDFDYWKLYERPWHTSTCHYLMIDDTITSIGQYAFYGIESIKYVFINSRTFIENTNSFAGISYKPIFRITYDGEETRMIGTIPYTSYDSIKAFAQSNSMGASYIMDSNDRVTEFQESVNPTICNVYCATDQNAPWNNVENNGNGNVYTTIVRLSPVNPDYSLGVYASIKYPGIACYEAYAAFIDNYTLAETFNIVVTKEGKELEYTDKVMQYTLTIPTEHLQAGRSFRILAIAPGIVNIYDDLDTVDQTVTFATDYPTTSYALVYK